MKYYTSTTEFNCGIDLHARQIYVCLMDRQGKKLVHINIKNIEWIALGCTAESFWTVPQRLIAGLESRARSDLALLD